MTKCKIGICGNFDTSVNNANGQTQKTINVYSRLVDRYGEGDICCFDTALFRKNPIKAFYLYNDFLKKCDNIVLLPAQSAINFIVSIAISKQKKYKFKVFYLVIGNWLADFIKNKPKLRDKLKKIECIYPETESLKKKLERQGLHNLEIMVNFKNIPPIEKDEIKTEFSSPYKICYFSRVTPQKGVDDLIKAVKELNEDSVKFILDIYGPVFDGYREEFYKSIDPPYINYKGIVEYDKGKDVLKEYFVHVFPTKYTGDGIPGSIVDSYIAGVPLIASEWSACTEIIDEGKTGIIYKFGEYSGLKEKLMEAYNNPKQMVDMRSNCIEKANVYSGPDVMKSLYDKIESK